MAGRLFDAARRRQASAEAGSRVVEVERPRLRFADETAPDPEDYGLDGDPGGYEAKPDRLAGPAAPAAADEGTRDAQRDAYVDYAVLVVPLFAETLEDLRRWWLDEAAARERYGVVAGTQAYDRLVLACELRKADLQPTFFMR